MKLNDNHKKTLRQCRFSENLKTAKVYDGVKNRRNDTADKTPTTPGDRTKMSGVLAVESSTTWRRSRTGGSTNLEPRLLTMNELTQNATRSCRSERTSSIRCSSLHELSHSPVCNIINISIHQPSPYLHTDIGKVGVGNYAHKQQRVALTGRNTTGPPCSVTAEL